MNTSSTGLLDTLRAKQPHNAYPDPHYAYEEIWPSLRLWRNLTLATLMKKSDPHYAYEEILSVIRS